MRGFLPSISRKSRVALSVREQTISRVSGPLFFWSFEEVWSFSLRTTQHYYLSDFLECVSHESDVSLPLLLHSVSNHKKSSPVDLSVSSNYTDVSHTNAFNSEFVRHTVKCAIVLVCRLDLSLFFDSMTESLRICHS